MQNPRRSRVDGRGFFADGWFEARGHPRCRAKDPLNDQTAGLRFPQGDFLSIRPRLYIRRRRPPGSLSLNQTSAVGSLAKTLKWSRSPTPLLVST